MLLEMNCKLVEMFSKNYPPMTKEEYSQFVKGHPEAIESLNPELREFAKKIALE